MNVSLQVYVTFKVGASLNSAMFKRCPLKTHMSKQGRIIRLDSYRRERRAQQQQHKRNRIQSGFHYAEQALRIMIEEADLRGHTDTTAVWYATVRAAVKALKAQGWTREELLLLIKDCE